MKDYGYYYYHNAAAAFAAGNLPRVVVGENTQPASHAKVSASLLAFGGRFLTAQIADMIIIIIELQTREALLLY